MAAAATPEERVQAGLVEWANRASQGKVRWRSFVPTPLRNGEMVAAMVRQVFLREVPADEAEQYLDERVWRHSDQPTEYGMVVATDQRLMLVGNRNRVLRELTWESVASMRMSADMRAMLVQEAGHEDTLLAIIRQQYMLLSAPKGVEVATHLISLEGAWYLWQGKLDMWLRSLPGRFAR